MRLVSLSIITRICDARNYMQVMSSPLEDERTLGERIDSPCQPTFYIIGAMKAGTTDLAEVLSHVHGWGRSRVRAPRISVHEHEHHFWEAYPAFDWESGGDAHVINDTSTLRAKLHHNSSDSDATVAWKPHPWTPSMLNGSYLGFRGLPYTPWPPTNWEGPDTAALIACERLVLGRAPLEAAAAIEESKERRSSSSSSSSSSRRGGSRGRPQGDRHHEASSHGGRGAAASIESVCEGARGTLVESLLNHHGYQRLASHQARA